MFTHVLSILYHCYIVFINFLSIFITVYQLYQHLSTFINFYQLLYQLLYILSLTFLST